MSRVSSAALVLTLAVMVTGCSARRETVGVPTRPLPVRHVLSNGLRIVTEERRSSEVVALQLWVKAGARDEAPSELGLAHYLEHLLFKGTTSRAIGAIEREIEGMGGRINAGTSLDYTYYHLVVPAARLTAGVETLADIAVNASLEEGAIEREKGVVLEEIRRADDDPRGALMRRMYATIFDGHPYGRPILGTASLIRSRSRESVVSFYRHFYVPESFTLVAVGPVASSDVIAAAATAFGRLPRGGLERLPVAPPPPPVRRAAEVKRPGRHAYLSLGWIAPKLDHADAPAAELLASILGRTRSSRLTQALRERLGLVTSIGVSYAPLEAAGIITVVAELPPDNVDRAESEIVRELRRLQLEGVGEAERRRAVTAALAQHEFARETAEGRAWALGRAETVWRLGEEQAWVDRLAAVTLEQLHLAARRYLDPARSTRILFLPGDRS